MNLTMGRFDVAAIVKTTILQRSENQIFSEVDDEVVMLSIDNNEYYYLNSPASSIWRYLIDEQTVENLITHLVNEFDVTYNQCYTDLIPYIKEAIKSGIIEMKI